ASWCRPGPVTVTFERRGGTIEKLSLGVGGEALLPAAVDLTADAAVRLLVHDIARATSGQRASFAIQAAVLADTESWPALLELARDSAVAESTRRAAHTWLAMEASERVLAEV